MIQNGASFLPRVGVAWGDRRLSALPLALRGEEACLVLREVPPWGADVRLVLDWPDGRATELGGRLRDVAMDGRTACFDIRRVARDWAPFVDWLGRRATG